MAIHSGIKRAGSVCRRVRGQSEAVVSGSSEVGAVYYLHWCARPNSQLDVSMHSPVMQDNFCMFHTAIICSIFASQQRELVCVSHTCPRHPPGSAPKLDMACLCIAALVSYGADSLSCLSCQLQGSSPPERPHAAVFAKRHVCIPCADEIDAIAAKRENAQREMERRIVAQMLTCMDDLCQIPADNQETDAAETAPDQEDARQSAAQQARHVIIIGGFHH